MVSELVKFTDGSEWLVLILVVVEYGLEVFHVHLKQNMDCLNPCCRGIWSRS